MDRVGDLRSVGGRGVQVGEALMDIKICAMGVGVTV